MNDNLPELGGTKIEETSLPPVSTPEVKKDVPPVISEPQSVKGRSRKTGRKYMLVWGVVLVMALLIGAVGLGVYFYSKNSPKKHVQEQTEADVVKPAEVAAVPQIPLSSEPYSGLYGKSAVEMQLDFSTGEGFRFYRADPHNKFNLRVTDVRPAGEGAYYVEITEFIESRIKVGVYKGLLTDSDFKGEFVSTHGDRREVLLTR
ncbi:MAG: hypothetical protein K2M07_01315 [Muribaculaceae bacterium]|nr:hypothetical protein [Muribaculaceae bacterium]